MKYELKDFDNAAAFIEAFAKEEKSGQLANIAELIRWAGALIYMDPTAAVPDWKERLEYEYAHLEERCRRVASALENWDKLQYDPGTPKELSAEQLEAMLDYKMAMERRAEIRGMKLPKNALGWHVQG